MSVEPATDEAARFLRYIELKRARRKWCRWWFGPMLDNQMIDPAFDDMTTDDLVTGNPVWYDDTTLSDKRKKYGAAKAADASLVERDRPIMQRMVQEWRDG